MVSLERTRDNEDQSCQHDDDEVQVVSKPTQVHVDAKSQKNNYTTATAFPSLKRKMREEENNSPYHQALITPSPSQDTLKLVKRRKSNSSILQGQGSCIDDECSRFSDGDDCSSVMTGMTGMTGTTSTYVSTTKKKAQLDGTKEFTSSTSSSSETALSTAGQSISAVSNDNESGNLNHNRSELIMSVADALTNLTSSRSSSSNKQVSEDDDDGDDGDEDEEEVDSSSIENEYRSNMNSSRKDTHGNGTQKVASKPKKGRRERAIRFPVKLMNVLSCGQYDDIISWTPDGASFVVHSPKQLVERVFPHHFKEVKYPSFTRKLHRWGFVKILRGKEVSAYSHKNFKRGHIKECEDMRCCKPTRPSYAALAAGAVDRSIALRSTGGYDTAGPAAFMGNHNHNHYSHHGYNHNHNRAQRVMTSQQHQQHQDYNRQKSTQDEFAYMQQLRLRQQQQQGRAGLNAASHNGMVRTGASMDDMALLRNENLVHRRMLENSPNMMMAAGQGSRHQNHDNNSRFSSGDLERMNLRSNLFSDNAMLHRHQQQQQQQAFNQPPFQSRNGGSGSTGASDYTPNQLALINAQLEAENRAIDRILGRLPPVVRNSNEFLNNNQHQYAQSTGSGRVYDNHRAMGGIGGHGVNSLNALQYNDRAQELSVMDLVQQQNRNLAMITSNNANILQNATHGCEPEHERMNIHSQSHHHPVRGGAGGVGDRRSDLAHMDIRGRTRNVLASRIINGQTNGFHGRGL